VSDFRFAQPQFVHAIWAVIAFVSLLFWLERRSGGALDRIVGSGLQSRLVRRPNSWRRYARIVLLGLSAACLVGALMRPQLGVRYVAAQRVGAEIMIALDVSKSMLAEDVAPNRLERAKAEIVDLLSYLDGDQVGLIAFAGRATVLAPLTPDFSFLRLVLEGAGPHTVARGGTKLEEPIRKAVNGFGEIGDASRALLLITDGEDHDSFPLDAAAAAAEAGVIIIAIGFGDENGSEVYITDPDTGARELMRDGGGRPVRSRLDGDLLRDMALATGGAYVPAGTGVLDLESIYRQHIASLTTGQLDPRGRTVRDEVYQWAVLLALVFLVSGVAVSSATGAVAVIALLFVVTGRSDLAAAGDAVSADANASGAPSERSEPEPQTPRAFFNRGVAALTAGEFQEALRRLERARRDAAGDSELRFRAAYDLGLASASLAEQLEVDSPQEALNSLYTAADWFRDAVGQRPDDEDSRVNLEIALRRALLLADRLATRPEGLEAELKQLASRQREVVGDLAGLLQLLSDDPELFAEDRLRREFRARAASQRALLSDGDRLAREIDTERESLASRPEEDRSPEEQMRVAQLGGVLHYLHRAREKMGQTRRQLRQRQGDRAYRRGSGALAELKRAIDQLSDPVALIDVLLRDAGEVAKGTAMLETARRADLAGAGDAPRAPVWLSSESLAGDQRQVVERVGELDERLRAGLEQDPGPDPQARELIASVAQAQPFVASAQEKLASAATSLDSDEPGAALPPQAGAISALAEARERFLDLRGLIEATYADEQRIAEVLEAGIEWSEQERKEFLPALVEFQRRNIDRAERLEAKLAARAAFPPVPGPAGDAPDAEAEAIRQRRFELAGQLLTLTLGGMDEVHSSLGGEAPKRLSWSDAQQAGSAAVGHLEMLRRLFLSIAEQLRDALRQQIDLVDTTQDAAALGDPASSTAPQSSLRDWPTLSTRQAELATRAGELSIALEEQSNQSGGVLEEESDGFETSRRLRVAGEHVLVAQTEMEGAAKGLGGEPPPLEDVRIRQDAAVSELELALAELVPPEEREEEQQQDASDESEQPDEKEEQEQGQGADPQQAQQPAGPQTVDPAQLLQEVRDREAQRRREREGRGSTKYETVERDW